MRPDGDLIRALRLPLLLGVLLSGGCGGGSSHPAANSGLVVGAASGPIYDELASAYQLSRGDGSESPDDFRVVIYDGGSLTPEEIADLPSTDRFLNAGKLLIILDPSVEDLQALEGELGAAPLVDTAAVAVFKTFSDDGLLENATMVEFPATLTENPTPPGAADVEALPAGAATRVAVDDQTLRAHARAWVRIYESELREAARSVGSRAGSSPAQLGGAESDGAHGSTAVAFGELGSDGSSDLSDWLDAPANVPPAGGSPFWTVRQFTHTRPLMLQMTSALYDPANQEVRRDSTAVTQRGVCFFLPNGAAFTLKPAAPSTATVLVTHVVNRMLQETGPGTYNHNVILRQFIRSSPNVLRPDAGPIGTEKVNFCRALAANTVPPFNWYCTDNGFGCNAFSEDYPLQSLLGFNAQVKSTLSWDPASAPLLSVSSVRPLAANNVSDVTTSENWSLGLNWSIQGALEVETVPPRIGLSGPGAGGEVKWGWSTAQNIKVKDWETRPNSSGATATHDLFAAAEGNSLANLTKFTTTTGSGVLSFTALTGLQESFLEARTETSWITTQALLPAGKSTLTSQVNLGYGEVYDRFSAVNHIDPAPLPYGAVHPFTMTLPIELDFTSPILRPPVKATWSIAANLSARPNSQGFFPVKGTVTLDEEAAADTKVELGAEIYNFGNSQPAPSVVKDLPERVTVAKGKRTATFDFQVRRIGSPYNVRVWAFSATGQQVAYPMTVPAS